MSDTTPETKPVFVIAEAGVNHNGSLERALAMVDAAAAAGADAVKFQTFTADKLVVPGAPKADYQADATGNREDQAAMLRRLELSPEAHHALAARCGELGIEFMSTPFDEEAVTFLAHDVGVRRLKVPSGEITNGPLLLAVARAGLPIILSTGMSGLEEVEAALGVLAYGFDPEPEAPPSRQAFADAYSRPDARQMLAERVTLLHCTSEYPAPVEETNLRAIATLRDSFGLRVGLSDHTLGTTVPLAAAALGAVVIEKHFTLDRALEGPDHAASLTPAEFTEMIAGIRDVTRALGRPDKTPTASERANRPIARRSLVATASIAAGEAFTETNLGARRPGTGIEPIRFWDYLGETAGRDYRPGEMIEP